MERLSPITIALSLMLFLSLGVLVFLIWRSLARDARTEAGVDSIERSDRTWRPTQGWVDSRPEEVRAPTRPVVDPGVADGDAEGQAQLSEWRRWQRRRASTSASFAPTYG